MFWNCIQFLIFIKTSHYKGSVLLIIVRLQLVFFVLNVRRDVNQEFAVSSW